MALGTTALALCHVAALALCSWQVGAEVEVSRAQSPRVRHLLTGDKCWCVDAMISQGFAFEIC